MNKRMVFPIFAMSVSSIVTNVGHGSWVVPAFNERPNQISTKPSTPVCYIQSKPSVKYMTIEKALEIANKSTSSENVIVIPRISQDFITPSYVISKDCEIGSNVTLTITYDESVTNCDSDKNGSIAESRSYLADSSTRYKTYLKSNIGLNATLTINGTLNICGKVGSTAQRPSGHTSSDYAQLSMFDNSKITCENGGKINCFGYIKEWYSKSNGHVKNALRDSNGSSIALQNGSIIDMPGVIYDFYGGSFSSSAVSSSYANAFPFTSFDFPNIQTTLKVSFGSSINASSQVYASSQANYFEMKVLGSTNEYLFVMSQGCEMTYKYNSVSPNFSNLYATDGLKSNWSTTSIDVESGTLGINAISIKGYSSASYYLPINFKYEIVVKNGGILNFNNKVKFLTGSSLVVEQGGTVNFNASALFHQRFNVIGTERFTDDTNKKVTSTEATYPFPSDENVKSFRQLSEASAYFLNSGTVNINSSFGGFITAGSSGAKIVFGSNSSTTANENSVIFDGVKSHDYLNYRDVKGYANGLIGENGTRRVFSVNKEYVSNGKYWIGDESGSLITGETYENFGTLKKASCLLPTVSILMADGTYKKVESIKTGDMVISFNHETGMFEPNRVIGNDDISKQAETYNVVHLEFSNGKSTGFIYEHGYFDKTLNKYVYLHEDDFADYINHDFVFYENGSVAVGKLIRGSISKIFTTLASPATANHLNLIVDGMLSIGGGLDGLFNIFEYDPDTLAFDKEKMKADIQKYGLLGYERFEKYFPKEIYDLLPCKYLGVSIGKGLITWDIFEGYVNKWKDQLLENLK